MPDLTAVSVSDSLPVVEEAVAQYHYSIRNFFEWHHVLIKNVFGWSLENGSSLVAGACGVGITILLCYVFLFVIRKVIIPFINKWHEYTAREMMAVSGPVSWLLFWSGFSISVDFMPFPEKMHQTLDTLFYICFMFTLINIFLHALQGVVSIMHIRLRSKDPQNYNMNKLLLDLSLSIFSMGIWIFATIFILEECFLLNVTHLLASAGILGLAIAFAAKDTIANIFGAFALLGGKMCRVGDWIKTGSAEGVVEQVGIRSIKIRAFEDGRLIDIPNHIIADSQIENFSKSLFWREYFCFGLVCKTTPEQIDKAKAILNDIVREMESYLAEERKPQFDFMLIDQYSLNIEGYVWFKASHWLEMRQARGRFNEEVLKRFNAAGLEFAFPTTTVLMEKSEKGQ